MAKSLKRRLEMLIKMDDVPMVNVVALLNFINSRANLFRKNDISETRQRPVLNLACKNEKVTDGYDLMDEIKVVHIRTLKPSADNLQAEVHVEIAHQVYWRTIANERNLYQIARVPKKYFDSACDILIGSSS
jgi:hypothetical protein